MHDDDTLKRAAIKATRIAAVIYVIVKQVFYMTLVEEIYWMPRTIGNVIMVTAAFVLTHEKLFSKKQMSWIVPLAMALTEIFLVSSYGGDRLTYIFLIGCALLSLLYMDLKGLIITAAGTCSGVAVCLFLLEHTLIGEEYTFSDDIFNFAGVVVVDILIILIGRFSIGTLAKSKQDVEIALREAQAANKAKSEFLATMSHEIRTPINVILGLTQIQMQSDDLPDKYADALDKIHNSGAALLGIINDILDLSKIETGKLELHPTRYDTASLINDAVQLNAVRIGSKPIKFILDIDEKLPNSLYGDELRIKQVLNNLLSNAVKYTEKGEVRLKVYAQPKPTEQGDNNQSSMANYQFEAGIQLVFEVSDTGQGMKPEDMKKLFTEYQRFNIEANRTTEGTGLGLNITKRLLAMMDGDISVESEYGKGSVFTATVIQRVEDSTPIGAETARRLCGFIYTDGRAKERRKRARNVMPHGSVLIVDDVESNLFVAEGLLSPYKLQIEKANSGFKAIEKVESGNVYDIIFMDHMMPKMDGVETTKKLRQMGYTGAIVALTANALSGNAEMFAQNGFDGFIPKPVDIRRMDAILNKFIRTRHPEEATELITAEVNGGMPEISDKLKELFVGEAREAVYTLRETQASEDLKSFTITVHSMKSALANVGQHDASQVAAGLEAAARRGDTAYINEKTAEFTNMLEEIADKLIGGK